jgi:hypothetical protein
MRNTKMVSIWPVGFVGELKFYLLFNIKRKLKHNIKPIGRLLYEKPICENNKVLKNIYYVENQSTLT